MNSMELHNQCLEVGIASVKLLGAYYTDYGNFFEICHANSKVLPPMPLSTQGMKA